MKIKKNVMPLILGSLALGYSLMSCEKKKDTPSTDNQLISITFGDKMKTPVKDTVHFEFTANDTTRFKKIAPADIAISEGAIIEPAKDSALNFTKPVTYYVTAEDMRSARKYTVVIAFPADTAKK